MTPFEMEAQARELTNLIDGLDPAHSDLINMLLWYGEHKDDCHKFGMHGNIENDCSCGWGPIHYYLRTIQRELEATR